MEKLKCEAESLASCHRRYSWAHVCEDVAGGRATAEAHATKH